jgi:hypothetical protein
MAPAMVLVHSSLFHSVVYFTLIFVDNGGPRLCGVGVGTAHLKKKIPVKTE